MDMTDNAITSKTFLKNHQPLMFIQVVLMDVAQSKFPDQFALQSLFELILVSNSRHKHEQFLAKDH